MVRDDWLPLNTSGLVVITPTAGLLLVTSTLTDRPPRTDSKAARFSVTGFKRAGAIVIVTLAAEAVRLKSPGVLMTNPEGSTVTALVPSA